jgi:hypothetical protein
MLSLSPVGPPGCRQSCSLVGRAAALAALGAFAALGCTKAHISGNEDGGTGTGDAGSGGRGGGAGGGGAAGVIGSGGALGAGGSAGSGGSPGTGGTTGGGGTTGSGGITGTGGTPGTGGSTPVTPATLGDLVIDEIMINPAIVDDTLGEWFEIHNPSASVTYDLFNCVLSDTVGTHTVNGHVFVLPQDYFTLATTSDPTLVGFTPDYSYGGALKFNNDVIAGDNGDRARITCGGTLIDEIVYSSPAWTWTTGRTLSLDPNHLNPNDNDLPANWCFGTGNYHPNNANSGTPGVANPPCQ